MADPASPALPRRAGRDPAGARGRAPRRRAAGARGGCRGRCSRRRPDRAPRRGAPGRARGGRCPRAPLVYSFSVWLAPVDGTFPAAGPYSHAGYGGLGVSPASVQASRSLISYLDSHGATKPYALLTQSSNLSSPLILLGLASSAEGGYGASDPALSNTALAALVAAGKARYLMIGGPYATRGGNSANNAARLVCPEIPQILWALDSPAYGAFLVDCAGRADALRHPTETARRFLRAHPSVHYGL